MSPIVGYLDVLCRSGNDFFRGLVHQRRVEQIFCSEILSVYLFIVLQSSLRVYRLAVAVSVEDSVGVLAAPIIREVIVPHREAATLQVFDVRVILGE